MMHRLRRSVRAEPTLGRADYSLFCGLLFDGSTQESVDGPELMAHFAADSGPGS